MERVPDCTVVVPTYNREAILRRTLDALVRQDLGTDRFEVLVVDDGSTDGTAAAVRAYQGRLDLQYFYQPDQGFRAAAARNVGIAHARAGLTVFLDSGVLAHSGCLTSHLRRHQEPGRVAVIGYVYCFNSDNEDADLMCRTLDFDDVDGTVDRLERERRWLDVREDYYARQRGSIEDLPAPWLLYWTCNVSASTEQLRQVGGFDEAFVMWGSEDVDLGYRLHRDGARFVLDRSARAIHHPHEKNFAENKALAMQGRRYMARKYDTPVTRLLAVDRALSFYEVNDLLDERRTPRRDLVGVSATDAAGGGAA
jgi:glycosyltransferase involved in cell wall biosynthesis